MSETRDRWRRRKECHGSALLCCQYQDGPRCNGRHDPHLFGRLIYRLNTAREARRDRAWTKEQR